MAQDSYDSYLQIQGITGEATDRNHQGWIGVTHYSHSVAQEGAGAIASAGVRSIGKATHDNITLSKRVDKSSVYLSQKCCQGETIPQAIMEVCVTANGTQIVLLRYTMQQVMIKSVSSSASSSMPEEQIRLEYGSIQWEYTQIQNGSPQGHESANFDVQQNAANG